MDKAGGTEESYAVNFLMRADLFDHFVNLRPVVLEHLEVRRMQNDFTDCFNVILGVLQEDLLEGADIEKSKERDRDQQYDTGSEDVLADQTFAKGPEHGHHTQLLSNKKAGRRE